MKPTLSTYGYLSPDNQDYPSVYSKLFEALKSQNITWCSWKSNEHLINGLRGETDIDILFCEADRAHVVQIMHECSFIEFQAPAHRSYPNIIDTISIDLQSGHILHAHVHFLLVAGEKYLKNVVLPWNKYILNQSIPSEISDQIPIATPDVEAVLLFIRESLKIRSRDIRRTNQNQTWGNKHFQTELTWLKKRATNDEIIECANTLLNKNSANVIKEMLSSGTDFEHFKRLRTYVTSLAKEKGWRRMPHFSANMHIWLHEGLYIATRVAEKLGINQQFIVRRRTLPNEGVIVAFVGIDGSGKSTVTKTIISEWKNKLDIAHVYFGTGDGPPTLLRRLLKITLYTGTTIKKLFKKIRNPIQSREHTTTIKNDKASPSLVTLLYAIFSALDKRQQILRAQKLRNKGYIVICDRWPQNEVSSINDGPFLTNYIQHRNKFYKKLALWENKYFEKTCGIQQPDIIFRLKPSLEMAIKRKKENSLVLDMIKRKITAFEEIKFNKKTEQYTINADQPLNDVLKQTRENIWSHLQKRKIDKTYLYECIGLPGSGKTTACNSLYKTSNLKPTHNIFTNTINIFDKMKLGLISIIYSPMSYIAALVLIFKLKLFKDKKSITYIMKLPSRSFRLRRAVKKDSYLLEQLLLQDIWSALTFCDINHVKPEILAPFITNLYYKTSTKILYFNVNIDTAALRIEQRKNGGSRFENMHPDKIKKNLSRFSTLIDDIITAASYAGLQVYTIDAALTASEVSKNVQKNVIFPFELSVMQTQ